MSRTTDPSQRPSVIVLAGGRSSRIGPIGRLIPKSMMPISGKETILSRLFRQLLEAGFRDIRISTSPDNYQLYSIFLERYQQEAEDLIASSGEVCMTMICNPKHQHGPSYAFMDLLEESFDHGCLLCLSDIFYITNPFLAENRKHDEGDVELFVAPYKRSVGGVVLTEAKKTKRISYAALSEEFEPILEPYNWTGAAFFNARSIREILESYEPQKQDEPLESILIHLLNQNYDMALNVVDGFINANNWADYTSTFAWA